MTNVHFLGPRDDSGRPVPVPIEIRDGRARLIKRTTAANIVPLDPGNYYVVIGSGDDVHRIEVQPGLVQQIVELDVPRQAPASDPWERRREIFRGTKERGSASREEDLPAVQGEALGGDWEESGVARPAAPPPRRDEPPDAELLAGRVFDSRLKLADVTSHLRRQRSTRGDVIRWDVQGLPRDREHILRVVSGPGDVLNVVLPHADHLIVYLRRTAGRWLPEIHLEDSAADTVFQFLSGAQRSALDAATRMPEFGEALLEEKRRNPFGAAVGAYALLRMNDLERLHDWTGNLHAWFPWLPDGAAIRAEHLAREGEHAAALGCLQELLHRGLPGLRDGLDYAHDRLSTYARIEDANLDRELARSLLSKLGRIARYVDRTLQLVAFPGNDPTRPWSKEAPRVRRPPRTGRRGTSRDDPVSGAGRPAPAQGPARGPIILSQPSPVKAGSLFAVTIVGGVPPYVYLPRVGPGYVAGLFVTPSGLVEVPDSALPGQKIEIEVIDSGVPRRRARVVNTVA